MILVVPVLVTHHVVCFVVVVFWCVGVGACVGVCVHACVRMHACLCVCVCVCVCVCMFKD